MITNFFLHYLKQYYQGYCPLIVKQSMQQLISKISRLFDKKSNSQSIIAISLICLITLTGCRVAGTRANQIIVASPSDVATFNYPLNQSAYSIFGFLYDSLINENGQTGELEPGLAESWQISPDGQKIKIKLRAGLKWSDGQPITSDDIIFSYNQIYLNNDIPTSFKDILRIGQSGAFPIVTKINDLEVEFATPEPFAPFVRYAGGLPIMPKHKLEKSLQTKDSEGNLNFLTTWETDTPVQEIVGNGGYIIKLHVPNQRIRLERNPYYWRRDKSGEAQPYITNIVWQVMESADARFLNFRSGNLDTVEVEPDMFALLKREEKRGNYTIYNGGPSSDSSFLAFNLNKGKNSKGEPFVNPIKSAWFNNQKFRQAVAYGINREVMKNNIYQGLGALQYSSISVNSPFHLSPQDGLPTYEYNPAKAKELLLSAGFQYNDQGQLLDSQGNRVQFTILSSAGRKVRELMATQIKQDLAALGMQADLQFLSFNTYVERLSISKNWDAFLGGFTGGGVEPHSGYNIWSVQGRLHTFNQGPQPGGEPIEGWQPSDWEKKIDELYVKASQEMNEAKRKEYYAESQIIIAEQLPFIYMVTPLDLTAVRNRIRGLKYTSLGGTFWNLYELRTN